MLKLIKQANFISTLVVVLFFFFFIIPCFGIGRLQQLCPLQILSNHRRPLHRWNTQIMIPARCVFLYSSIYKYDSGCLWFNSLVSVVQLEFQYFQPHASLTASVSLHQTPPINFSATLGTPTFALGAEAAYETSSRKLTKYTAGITVTKPDSCASITL